jgi:hypothetical protein
MGPEQGYEGLSEEVPLVQGMNLNLKPEGLKTQAIYLRMHLL